MTTFNDKLNEFKNKFDVNDDKPVKENKVDPPVNKTKKDKLQDVIIENNDISHFTNPVLIPSHIIEQVINLSSKSSYMSLYVLCKHCNHEGIVDNLTLNEISSYYNYQCYRTIFNGIQQLESNGIIDVDRKQKPHTYTINDYSFKNMRGTVIPEETMNDLYNTTAKELRLQWYYMFRNHHSPRNQNKLDFTLSHLKETIKTASYNELYNLAKNLKGKFFDMIDKTKEKLKVTFDKSGLGLLLDKQDKLESVRYQYDPKTFDRIKSIFKNVGVTLSACNLRMVQGWLDNYSMSDIISVQRNSSKPRYYSNKDSVWYIKKLLDLARKGAIRI